MNFNESIEALNQCTIEMGATQPAQFEYKSEQRPFSATLLSSVLRHEYMTLLLPVTRNEFKDADKLGVGDTIQCKVEKSGETFDIFAVCREHDWSIIVTKLEAPIDNDPFTYEDVQKVENVILSAMPEYKMLTIWDATAIEYYVRMNATKVQDHAVRYMKHGFDVMFRVLYTTGKPVVNIVKMS